jgi:hypothetical protein
MSMAVQLQYVSDEQGNAVGVIVPIELWRDIEAKGLPFDNEGAEPAATHRQQMVDLQAFSKAAGSWQDVDTAAFVRSMREQREQSYRPAVEL